MSMTFPSVTLLLISILTNLTVEGIKKVLNKTDAKYSSNLLAVIVSIALALAVCGAYMIVNDIAITAKIGVEITALTYVSFLIATVGYDKVMQMLGQIKITK